MRILKEGDKATGLCESCKTRVPMTYQYGSVYLEKSKVDVSNVLVGVCDVCDETVSIPAQSFPRLKEAREKAEKKIEARIPYELDDIIRLISDYYHVSDTDFRSSLLRFYLYKFVQSDSLVRRVKRLSKNELALQKTRTRISMRVSDTLWNDVWSVAHQAGLDNWSSIIKGIILAAQEDVFSKRSPKRREELECIAAST